MYDLRITDLGSKLGLEECDESSQQQFVFTKEGQIRPRESPQLCLSAGEETRFGRNGTSPHQISDLTAEACSEDIAKFQQWRTRSEAD
ncbi:MAG: RICIN domain-containing protein [Acidiferrobacterales bacterium]|nr:RICIN domain-containing protein [Acidiferrobacterales bacterium]